MKMNTTILVDQDGVLADYTGRLLAIVAEEYPHEQVLTAEDLTLFDTHLNFSLENQEAIEQIALREGFFESLEPIEGSVEAMHDLLARGFDVRVCTAPKKAYRFCVTEKLAWIEKYLGREFVLRTILSRDKTLVRGDILIDDKPAVNGIAVPTWEHVLFDWRYNRDVPGKRRLTWRNYRAVLGLDE